MGGSAILATAGTVASGAYERAIHSENDSMNVFARPAPLFVPLAEEGWVTGEVPQLAARRYLQPLADADVDTIVLGCTHYPLLSEMIHEVAADLLGHDVAIVDSAEATAATLTEMLDASSTALGASGLAADPGDRSPGPVWRRRLQIPGQTPPGLGYSRNRPLSLRITVLSR